MTRHTGEVDVYHLGRWKGLGSRHNVQHWGCSAKQLRISSAIYRRFYYYLTADERTGDLLDELARRRARPSWPSTRIRKVRTDVYTAGPRTRCRRARHGLGRTRRGLAHASGSGTATSRPRDRLLGHDGRHRRTARTASSPARRCWTWTPDGSTPAATGSRSRTCRPCSGWSRSAPSSSTWTRRTRVREGLAALLPAVPGPARGAGSRGRPAAARASHSSRRTAGSPRTPPHAPATRSWPDWPGASSSSTTATSSTATPCNARRTGRPPVDGRADARSTKPLSSAPTAPRSTGWPRSRTCP